LLLNELLKMPPTHLLQFGLMPPSWRVGEDASLGGERKEHTNGNSKGGRMCEWRGGRSRVGREE
jgi:hypothetical protein